MANKLYVRHETTISFGNDTDTVLWTPKSITDTNGRQSAFHDQGTDGTARAMLWFYLFKFQCQATPTVGKAIRCYLKIESGGIASNDDGTADAALSNEDKLRNLIPLRSPIVDEAAADKQFVSTGTILIAAEKFAVVMFNDTGATITADDTENKAFFTPIPPELQ